MVIMRINPRPAPLLFYCLMSVYFTHQGRASVWESIQGK